MPSERDDLRTPLSRERILDAALGRIDGGGLRSLSMRRLGADLGVEAMSLYNHFASKDEILDGVVVRVLEAAEAPGSEVVGWRARITAASRAFARVAAAHPNATALFAERPLVAYAGGHRVSECILAALRQAGFEEPDAIRALRLISRYLLGMAMVEASFAGGDPPGPVPGAEGSLVYTVARGFTEVDSATFLDAGLALLLDGLELALVRSGEGGRGERPPAAPGSPR